MAATSREWRPAQVRAAHGASSAGIREAKAGSLRAFSGRPRRTLREPYLILPRLCCTCPSEEYEIKASGFKPVRCMMVSLCACFP